MNPGKLLLIEDDDLVREVVSRLLHALGWQVVPARDGKEGLEIFRAEPADLVITDLIMPGKEGLETIRELRELAPDVRILAMSGGGRSLSGEHALELALNLGADAVLEKPFGRPELETTLARIG